MGKKISTFDGPKLPDSFVWKEPGTGDEPCEEGYQEVACSNFCGRTKEYDPPTKLRLIFCVKSISQKKLLNIRKHSGSENLKKSRQKNP